MAYYAPGSDEARRQREARDAGLRTNTGLRPGGSQGDVGETLGGPANDPRWRENGGHWGPFSSGSPGRSASMPAYSQPSQRAFGLPQAGHERTANQRRADRSAAFNRMHGGSQQAVPMEAYRPQQSAPAFTPGRAQSVQAPSQGTPYTPPTSQRGGPPQHRDFERSGDFGTMAIVNWVNPQTGERFTASDGTYQPRPGSGWVEDRGGAGGRGAEAPQQQAPRPSNSAFADAWNFSMEGNASRMAPARTFGGGGAGNMAYMPDNARPAPFTSYAIGPDGRQVSQQQSLNNRDALISALIQDNAQHAGRSGVYQGRGNPPPEFMAPPPPPNIPALWGQAQNAVSNGWVSPVAGLWG